MRVFAENCLHERKDAFGNTLSFILTLRNRRSTVTLRVRQIKQGHYNAKAHIFLSLAALSLSGCSLFSNRPPVPVVREGFVVKEAPVPQDNMTAFLPEGDTIDLYGSMI